MRKCMMLFLALALLLTPALAEGEDVRARAEAICDALLAGDYASVVAQFDEAMAAQVSAEALEQGWSATLPLLGEYRGRGAATEADQGEYQTVVVEERFANGNLSIQLAFDGAGRVAGLVARPTAPEATEDAATEAGPWTEAELTVQADPSYPLGATLCLPEGVERPPVVVLVQGSGASDRDEAVYANHPFRDIAHGLAERGVATLRYDKRTYVYPEAAGESGVDIDIRAETLDDANAAIALMRAEARVDGERIFVLGHSLGGMMVPAIAAENPDLAGAISMAGSLRRLWEIVYDQNMEAIAAYEGVELPAEQRAALDAQVEQIEAAMETFRAGIGGLADDSLLLGIPARYWKSLEEYAGMNFIGEIDLPLLILQGDADFQVYPDADYPLWQEALAGRENVQFHLYAGLNHMMMPTQGLRDLTEYLAPSQVSGAVIDDIAAFVQAN